MAPALIGGGATVAFIVVIVTSPAGWIGIFEGFPRWLAALCIIPFALFGLLSILSLSSCSLWSSGHSSSSALGRPFLLPGLYIVFALSLVVVAVALVLLWQVWR